MSSHDASATGLLDRVLVFVGGPRDGEITRRLLANAGMDATICADAADLCRKMEEGAGAAVLAEAVLTPASLAVLSTALNRQPPWSDFPIVLFSASRADVRTLDPLVRILGNVTFLDRPVHTRSMLAAVHAAIRSRRRQYEGRRAIDSRDMFLAMLGHELRNPLGAICLAVAMLDRKTAEAERPKEHAIIRRQARHLARLVEDLLDVARITQGKVALAWERLDLVGIVRDACDALESRAHEHRHAFELSVPDEQVWIDGDRQRLEQVLANLVTNAIKYTPLGGTISVEVAREQDVATVRVTDNGVGIPAELLGSVFDPFAQAPRSLARTEGGIGLGLAVVRSIVELHRGTVEVRSEGAGRGSSFVVRLPAIVGPAEAAPSSHALEDALGTKRVVIVEDSPDIRELFAELLERDGHDVECAEDGPRGLEKILSFTPDIAFVDLGLPGFDGLELARRVRAQGSATRLVAVTGYGQPEERRQAAAAGFDDHLTKPVADTDLHDAMLRLGSDEQTVQGHR